MNTVKTILFLGVVAIHSAASAADYELTYTNTGETKDPFPLSQGVLRIPDWIHYYVKVREKKRIRQVGVSLEVVQGLEKERYEK